MELMHSDLDKAVLTAARLESTFVLRPDGSIVRVSHALLRLCSVAPARGLVRLADLLVNPAEADLLLQWLQNSRGPDMLALPTQVRVGPRSILSVELLASALPVDGGLQAFCALRTPAHSPLRETELEQQLSRQEVRLQQLRRDQAALLDSEFRWRFAMEGSGEGVWDWNVRSGEAVFSPLWKSIIGYADDEIPPRFEAWRERIHPQDLDRVLDVLGQYLQSDGGSYRVEFRMRCKDGTYIWIASCATAAVRDRNGKPLRIIGTHRDITERVRQRALLEQNEARLRTLSDSARTDRKRMKNELRVAAVAFESPVAMLVTDARLVIQRVNQAFVDCTGYSAREAVGQTPRLLASGVHDAAFYAGMWCAIQESGSWQGEVWGRRKNRELYPKWLSIHAVRDGAGGVSHYVGTETDISERKQTELALHKLNRLLARQKTQLSQLVAQNEAARECERKHIAREVHDELGQILTALRMEASFIAMRWGKRNAALNSRILAMRTLVDNAIQAVRDVVTHLRPTALDMGLHLALDWLCTDFVRHTGIACRLDSRDPGVQIDEARAIVVFRIVQESLTNIRRYAGASQVLVTLSLRGNELGVVVQDNGQGFDTEQVEQVRSFGLLGMKERALALGGRLDIISAPGQGTAIGLIMPYAPGSPGVLA